MNLINVDNFDFTFRKKLNFSEKITFGIEIEYLNVLKTNLINSTENFKGIKNDSWYFQNEPKLQKIIDGEIYGGEFVSPILKNTKKYLKQIKSVCEILKINNAKVNDLTAFQVHVSVDIFKNNVHFLENFLKLYMLYEDIIFQFGFYGQKPRKVITDFSQSISYKLYNILNNKKYDNYYDLIFLLRQTLHFKCSSIDFYNVRTRPENKSIKNTIEFRSFNGTLNEIFIENIINLCCSLIVASTNKNLDLEKIDYDLKVFKEKKFETEIIPKNIGKALEFANYIFTEDIDKAYFLKLYSLKR